MRRPAENEKGASQCGEGSPHAGKDHRNERENYRHSVRSQKQNIRGSQRRRTAKRKKRLYRQAGSIKPSDERASQPGPCASPGDGFSVEPAQTDRYQGSLFCY